MRRSEPNGIQAGLTVVLGESYPVLTPVYTPFTRSNSYECMRSGIVPAPESSPPQGVDTAATSIQRGGDRAYG